MCKNLRTYFLIGLLVISAQLCFADGGSNSFAFLGLPLSARLNAMGGANVSNNDAELSYVFSNPSLLSEQTHEVIELNYANLFGDLNFGSVLYSHNYKLNRFAAAVHFLDYGRFDYSNIDGSTIAGTFGAKDILIQLSYARQLNQYFSIGASLKPVTSVYEVYTSFALGADVGAHFQTKDTAFQAGLSLQNIGWQLKTFYEDGTRSMLPLNLQLGLSYRFKHAPIRLGLTIHNMQRWNLAYQSTNQPTENLQTGGITQVDGVDIKWYDMMFRHTIFSVEIVPKSERFYLALSYNHRRRQEMNVKDLRSLAGFSIGAGVRIKQFRLQYAFSQYQKGQFVHQVSLTADIKGFL